MRIDSLRDRFKGEDVFVCGTGPSARLFPWDVLDAKPTIGLNQAYRYRPMSVCLTAHPELIVEYDQLRADNSPNMYTTSWVAKAAKPPLQLKIDDPRHYVYRTEENWDLFKDPKPDTLFLGRGIQQTAIHLACVLGVSSVTLIGVDMAALGGDQHAHQQHVRYHGLAPKDVFREYYDWTCKARDLAWAHYKVPVMSLSPLLGAETADRDYRHLLSVHGLKPLPSPSDTSGYARPSTDKPDKAGK